LLKVLIGLTRNRFALFVQQLANISTDTECRAALGGSWASC